MSLIYTIINKQYHFMTCSDQFPVPIRLAVKSNLTNWCCLSVSNSGVHFSHSWLVLSCNMRVQPKTIFHLLIVTCDISRPSWWMKKGWVLGCGHCVCTFLQYFVTVIKDTQFVKHLCHWFLNVKVFLAASRETKSSWQILAHPGILWKLC